MNSPEYEKINNIFFIGIAGAGMSALAQYIRQTGKTVSGSDRNFKKNINIDTKIKLEKQGIKCYPQDCSGINEKTELVVVSTAIEKTVNEYQKALELNIPIIERSDLLSLVIQEKCCIAVAGTSGKSTVSAMIFHILDYAGHNPSIITGAEITSLIEPDKLGNAKYGKGKHIIIEVDESDGSITKYKPELGIILNIDKDHKELSELFSLFETFAKNVKFALIVNANDSKTMFYSSSKRHNFGYLTDTVIRGDNYIQNGLISNFAINDIPFEINMPGFHNVLNAIAATTVAWHIGIDVETSAEALKKYKGIHRRHQIIGIKNGITLIDDYAHNPAKLAAAIKSYQQGDGKLIVWFQPHGFGPTKFLRSEFVENIKHTLRKGDLLFMSEIYYAGGTAVKDISAKDLIDDLNLKNCFFIEDRKQCAQNFVKEADSGDIILLCGARDPTLSEFAEYVSGLLDES